MYLRYGDPSWDSSESSDPPPAPRSEANRRRAPSGASRLPSIVLHDVELHAVTERQAIDHLLDELDAGRGGVVITPNLDHLRRCQTDVHFDALVSEADLVVADGMPLVWASRLQGTPLPERVAGSNLISTLSEVAARRGRSVFLLGGANETAKGAAAILSSRYEGLKVAGTFAPPVGFERDPAQLEEIQKLLSASGADIVYVGLGSPKQERVISQLRGALPGAWWLGVGVSFSFLCGDVARAPDWMQRTGIEWLHRLYQEPRRLIKRYLFQGVPFGVQLLGRAAYNGVPNRLWRKRRDAASAAAWAHRQAEVPATSQEANGRLSPNGDGRPAQGDAVDLAADDEARALAAISPAVTSNDSSLGFMGASLAAIAGGDGDPGTGRLPRLRALVLLGGSVRPSPLSLATNRSVLDMPLDDGGSLLNYWLRQSVDLAAAAGMASLPVRVMVSHNAPEPTGAHEKFIGSYRVERDRSEYRGTGGVLRDVGQQYDDDDLILVANAAQVLLDPLPIIAAALDRQGADIAMVSHEDGTPSGMMLVTCKALRLIPATGFVDMKEQVLPLIASKFDVRVLRRHRPTGAPIRSLEDYVQALRLHHRRRSGKAVLTDPLAEDWSATFSIVEPGATADGSARVHDSVVLAGATVEPGAVLVRCVVCPGAVVRRDTTEVDRVIRPTRRDMRETGATTRSLATAASVAM